MPIRPTAMFAATLLLASVACAQSPDSPLEPGPNATVLQAGTQIVIVDVVVQDSNGKPVNGLKPENFVVTEGKQPQTVRHFELHTPAAAASVVTPALGPMPAGTFSNYTPVPANGTLTVLLLDSLNTSMIDQSFVRGQLQKFAKHQPPGSNIAIFGLTDHLIMLQGFSSDPAVLRDALAHKLMSRASAMLPNAGATGEHNFTDAMNGAGNLSNDPSGRNLAPSDVVSSTATSVYSGNLIAVNNLAVFDSVQAQFEAKERFEFTLDAFHTLARYLTAFPGRKNVIWFAGSFPAHIVVGNGDQVFTVGNGDEYRETGDLLARAQIAVYPVSAHGLDVDQSLNPASGNSPAMTPRGIAAQSGRSGAEDVVDHSTMEDIAANTGGHAFYNTNGISEAVSEVMDAGSNYYTLMYTPTNHNKKGFHAIHVELINAPADLKLSYRSGYYATPRPADATQPSPSADAVASFAERTTTNHASYDRDAMIHGAPTPQDILFKVRVLPIAGPPETILAPDNTLDPAHPAKGPYHRYAIDFALLPTAITLAPQPDGNHKYELKFNVYVYNREGKTLVVAHRNFRGSLKPDFYAKFIKGIVDTHMEISIPDGETYLRIGVEDVPADHFGAVEVATADVSRLTPLPVVKRPPVLAPKP
jgi:VWFA-related protein